MLPITENKKLCVPSDAPVLCAWCGKLIRAGSNKTPNRQFTSHGICVSCMASQSHFPIEDLSKADPELLDRLPFGIIRMTGEGQILSYSQGESKFSRLEPKEVLGKNFFREVAPCTRVAEFAGLLEKMHLQRRGGREQLVFLFRFPHGAMLMRIVMTYDGDADLANLILTPISVENGSQPKPESG